MIDEENIFNNLKGVEDKTPVPAIDAVEFVKVVESRRSVRVYKDSPLPENIVNQCLDLALLAPNSSNLQPWEFYWVRTPEQKAKLIKTCLDQPAARTAAELIVAVARTGTWRKHRTQMLERLQAARPPAPQGALDYYQKIVPVVYTLGPWSVLGRVKQLLFFFIGFFRPLPREPISRNQLITWAVKSTALACENLMLSFRAFGYDSCPIEGFDSSRLRRQLQLPRDAVVVMVVSAGKREPQGVYGPRIRFPREQFIKEI